MTRRTVSRRRVLGALGASTVAVAGCLGDTGAEATDHDPPVRGDPDADVTLEVYEDFSCPHCRRYNMQDLPVVAEQYLEPGLIRYEHRDFPFLNDQSWQAANAAREVFLEDGNAPFWEYQSELFARQTELGTSDIFAEIATGLDLDGQRVQSAAVDRSHDDILEADKSRGDSLGVPGTPAFVLDGELVESDLFGAIDGAIQ